MCASAGLLLFLSFVAGTRGFRLDASIIEQPRHLFPHSRLANSDGLFHTRALRRLPNVDSGRKLTQSGDNTCAWDDDAGQCFLTTGTVLDFLSEVDNPLSIYLRRAIPCELQLAEEDCAAQDCDWNGVYCQIPHEEFREFTSAPCLEDVRHIVDLQANSLQCTGLLGSRDLCEDAEGCAWVREYGFCVVDHWLYFHDIPLIDGFPEGFDEVSAELLAQLNEELATAQTNEDITDASDLLTFVPSEFDCPAEYDQILCDYVDAYTVALLTDGYCASAYPSVADQLVCSGDINCEPTIDPANPCIVAQSISLNAAREANEIFAEAIEDPEARKYVVEAIECAFTFEEESCGGSCVWSNDICLLSPRWAEEEAYRLIGETNNPVCQFYRSDVTTGCLDHEAIEDCTEDRQCVWLGNFNSCESGLYAWMDIALRGSATEEAFKEAEALCFDFSAEEECNGVDEDGDLGGSATSSQEETEDGYTDLSAAIGANKTIIGVVF